MKLTDDNLLAICEQELTRSRSYYGVTFDERATARRQYFQIPDEKKTRDGYSTAQTSETRDAIEQMLPILMDMYLQPESPVVFSPRGPNDLKQSQQETALVNNVIFSDNDGELLFLGWFKDALLEKNGYVKVYWDDALEDRVERYKNLTLDEYQQTLAELDERDEVVEIVERIDVETGEPRFDCKIKVVYGDAIVRIKNIPPSRVLVAADHHDVSLKDARWCCHFELKSKSDLVTDGYKKDVVEGIPPSNGDDTEGAVRLGQVGGGDWTRDLVNVYEHYIRADRDGDGRAELLQVVIAGDIGNGRVLSVEEVDFVNIIALTPFIIPHSHYGMALSDITRQFQDVNTHLVRQILDNINLSNNPMLYVNKTSIENPEKLAKARLGGIILGRGDGMPIQSVQVPFVAQQSYGVLQDMAMRMEKATGLSDAATGLNAEALAQSTNLVGAMMLGQAQLRPRMVATMFAATGVRELVLRVRELVMKHVDSMDMSGILGEQSVVNPRSWARSRKTKIRIGLGSVQRAERIGVLQNIMAMQEKIFGYQGGLEGPLVNHENIYNSLQEMADLSGSQGQDRYFTNPIPFLQQQAMQPEQPQPIDTALELEAAKTAITAQKNAAEIDIKKQELELEKEKLELQRIELGARINGVA